MLQLKRDISHLIQWREGALLFLQRLHQQGKQVFLVTNTHRDSLTLKMQQVNGFSKLFDGMICSHDYGYPKESPIF